MEILVQNPANFLITYLVCFGNSIVNLLQFGNMTTVVGGYTCRE